METPKHLFTGTEGHLYDTRRKHWEKKPLRTNYKWTHAQIKTVADLKATIRAGQYAWPGGYQLAFIAEDGCYICFDCVKAELRNVIDSIQTNTQDGWKVVAVDNVDEHDHDYDAQCEHCNKILAEGSIIDIDENEHKDLSNILPHDHWINTLKS